MAISSIGARNRGHRLARATGPALGEPTEINVTLELSCTEKEASSKMSVHHVPLRQSVEEIRLGKE